jgi:hypothetical protein
VVPLSPRHGISSGCGLRRRPPDMERKRKALRHEGVWGSGCIDLHFLDVGTSWRWVVSFTPRSLYLRGKRSHYPLDRRLGGPQSWSGRCEEKILDLTGIRTPTPRSSSPQLVAIPTTLSRLYIWKVAANVSNKLSSSLEFGRGVSNSSIDSVKVGIKFCSLWRMAHRSAIWET